MVNGTLINYYIHCPKQCWLHGNRVNLEDNSEDVKIGKALHELKAENKPNAEISIDHIKLDKLTEKYLVEIKKSDADLEAVKWQVLYYLKLLKDKGIERKGKIEFIEKNKTNSKVYYVELSNENLRELDEIIAKVNALIKTAYPPMVQLTSKCKKCAYYEYCIL